MTSKQLAQTLSLIILVAVSSLLVSSRAMASPVGPASVDDLTPLCRFGVNVSLTGNVSGITDFDTEPLRIGWYIDYRAHTNPAKPNGAEFAQMIRLKKVQGVNTPSLSPSAVGAIIDLNPGAIWLIGNEPDEIEEQDNVAPETYAELYHGLYHQIKQRDPSARVFPGSVVQGTEVRLKYLDLVLSHYRSRYGTLLPADGWSLHGFVLNEVNRANNPNGLEEWGAGIPPGIDDPTGLVIHDDIQKTVDFGLFAENIERFRVWMFKNGYRELPLYLSEYGVLPPKEWPFDPPFTEGRVNAYMDQTFDYLLTKTDSRYGYSADGNRLVQRLSWFSTYDEGKEGGPGYNGDLYSATGDQMTLIGQNYAKYAQKLAIETDFHPVSLFSRPIALISDGKKVNLTLEAVIANSGNNQNAKSVSVHFYDGDPKAGGTLIGTDVVEMNGCGETATATLAWTNVEPKDHQLFVVTEAADSDAESDAGNNTLSSRLFYNPDQTYLPMIAR